MKLDDLNKTLIDAHTMLLAGVREVGTYLDHWSEASVGLKERAGEFSDIVSEVDGLLKAVAKDSKSWEVIRAELVENKKLLDTSRDILKILSGPAQILSRMKDVTIISEQALRLGNELAASTISNQSDNDNVLSSLTEDQVRQVFEWVAQNERSRTA